MVSSLKWKTLAPIKCNKFCRHPKWDKPCRHQTDNRDCDNIAQILGNATNLHRFKNQICNVERDTSTQILKQELRQFCTDSETCNATILRSGPQYFIFSSTAASPSSLVMKSVPNCVVPSPRAPPRAGRRTTSGPRHTHAVHLQPST